MKRALVATALAAPKRQHLRAFHVPLWLLLAGLTKLQEGALNEESG